MICARCKEECTPIRVNFGFSAEDWRPSDDRYAEVSDCHEADLLPASCIGDPEDEDDETEGE